MPTPACAATAEVGARGSAVKTARAASRMRWSLRAASARRPLSGAVVVAPIRIPLASTWPILTERNIPFHTKLWYHIGTEHFVPSILTLRREGSLDNGRPEPDAAGNPDRRRARRRRDPAVSHRHSSG